MLSLLKCTLLSVPPHKGFTLPCMVKILQRWNLYIRTRLLKDVLHIPIHQTIGDHWRPDSLDHLINLQTQVKQN